MFEVVKNTELGTIWMPVNYKANVTLYVGQLVYCPSGTDYLVPLGAASSADTDKPMGVVVATNRRTALYDATYKTNSIAGATTAATQTAVEKQASQGAMFGVGDPIPLVQIKLIGPQTEVKGRIYSSTYGTAITPFNPQAATTGQYVKVSEASATSVAGNTTFYCRSGANKGIYRVPSTVANATNVTTNTFATYFPNSVATTDYWVKANVRQGLSKIQFDTYSMCVLAEETYSTNYYTVLVEEVNLEEAGKEYVIFRFV